MVVLHQREDAGSAPTVLGSREKGRERRPIRLISRPLPTPGLIVNGCLCLQLETGLDSCLPARTPARSLARWEVKLVNGTVASLLCRGGRRSCSPRICVTAAKVIVLFLSFSSLSRCGELIWKEPGWITVSDDNCGISRYPKDKDGNGSHSIPTPRGRYPFIACLKQHQNRQTLLRLR